MRQSFIVEGRLDGLNEYTKACRAGKYVGNRMKAKNQGRCRAAIRRAAVSAMTPPVHVSFIWHDKGPRHRDKDNIAFAKKFILDAMVDEGVLPDDSWGTVHSFDDKFPTADYDYVEVVVEELWDLV